MPLRLWEYTLKLIRHHLNHYKTDTLPLIYPIILYNGKQKYSAKRNIWDLFNQPELAKQILSNDHQLIDLNSTSDEDILQKDNIALFEYMLKHATTKDSVQLLEELCILLNQSQQELSFLYLSMFLCYIEERLNKNNYQKIKQIIYKHLSEKDGEKLMETIADSFIKQGVQQGLQQKNEAIIANLLRKNMSITDIVEISESSESVVREIATKMHIH